MNDPLNDIVEFLKAEEYANVFIGGFVDSENGSVNNNQISVEAEPGPNRPEQRIQKLFFAVYVKNTQSSVSRSQIWNIRSLFANRGGRLVSTGQPVAFKKFFVETEPHVFGASENGRTIYLARFRTLFIDNRLSTHRD